MRAKESSFCVDDVFIAVQIENVDALAVVEEIVSVEGIDALVVGPTDLSDSLGLRGSFEHPTVTGAIDRSGFNSVAQMH
jgi:2-dehydro-3-deoxyglucarate aldolase